MLGVQNDQVALGDEVDVSLMESMLCSWLSMHIQSSLIVIGASEGRSVHFLYASRGFD